MTPNSTSQLRMPYLYGVESQYFTWCPDGFDSDDLWGQPVSFSHENLFYESDSASCWGWKANVYDSSDQASQDFTGTYSGHNGNWLGEYISSFVGCWGDDSFFRGYDPSKDGCSGLEMVEDPCRGDEEHFGRHYNFDEELDMQGAMEHNIWFGDGFGFRCGFDEDNGEEENRRQCGHSWEEMELYDKIFGHWSSLITTDAGSISETEMI